MATENPRTHPALHRLRLLGLTIVASTASLIGLQTSTAFAAPVVTDTIAVGINPRQPTVSPDGSLVYVPNELSNTVSVIDTATNTVTAEIMGFTKPKMVAVSADGSTAYVTNANANTVSVVDTTSKTVTATIAVGTTPEEIALTPDGTRAYVTNNISDTVSVINIATKAVTTISGLDGPLGIAITPDGTKAYVAAAGGASVAVINTVTNTVISTLPANSPADVAVSPDGTRAYVTNRSNNTLSVIRTDTDSLITSIGGFNGIYGVAVSPDSKQIYAAGASILTQIDAASLAGTPYLAISAQFVGLHPDGSRAYVNEVVPKRVSVVALQPSPPEGAAASATVNAVNVSWTPPTFTGGQPITSYTATAQPGGRTCTTTATTCQITGLAAGTPYTVTITATNTLGTSMASAPTAATTPVSPGRIVVVKQTNPASDTTTVFTFDPSWSTEDFTLKNKGSNETVLAPGMYSVVEKGLTNWDLDSATCSDGSPANDIKLSAEETVTCTFTNTQRGEIIVTKVTDPPSDTATEFTFNPSWSTDNFTLKNQSSQNSGLLKPDTYSVEEINLPEGWDFSNATCSDDSEVGAIKLSAGETVTCTFTNTQRGKIIVKKLTDPVGDTSTDFTFDPSWTGKFTLKNGDSKETTLLRPGTYWVNEEVPFGWELTEVKCTGDSSSTEINLRPGGTVTCTFTNVKQTAELRLQKKVDGGGAAKPADWLLSAIAKAPFDGKNIKDVPGSNEQWATVYADELYTLSESAGPSNYTAGTGWQCVSDNQESVQPALDSEGDTVRLDPGDKVTCTIVNTRNLAELKLVKQVSGGKAAANEFTLTAKAAAPENDRNISTPGGSSSFEAVYAATQYTLTETGPGGYTAAQWVCESSEVAPQFVQSGDKITLDKGDRLTCTIVNSRDLGSLTITKEFNAQASGYTGTFDIHYTCLDGGDPVKSGTAKLGNGQSETISGLPTGTSCAVTEPTLPANPTGWTFNPPTFMPASGQATVTAKDQTVDVRVVNSVSQVSPVVVKKVCPIEPVLVKKVKKDGNRILIKKVKTNKNSCVLLKPVLLCQPPGSAAAGETAFCDTKVTKRGRVIVNTKGYDRVRARVIIRTKPKPGFGDHWKPNTWRNSWILKG